MVQRSFLGDMLTTLFERGRFNSRTKDDRSIEEMCQALLDAEGEVSGITLGQAVVERYAEMSDASKLAFFRFLNASLEVDLDALNAAIATYTASGDIRDYKRIARHAEPRRQELLRRLNQAPGATLCLVRMRADLLKAVKNEPELARADLDFQHLLRSWFNRGFLVLRQISWETPASILEKIVEYEAVHAIRDWDDLRRRLYPDDRRCFAFFHPAMPAEPLIFVEVALTQTVPTSIQQVLADMRKHRPAHETKVAVFYSISNCQAGLKGISFGNLLIKQVVAELRQELPGLETYLTLSPIPKFMAWLKEQDDPRFERIIDGTGQSDEIRAVATHYLLSAKSADGRPFDPVARFHFGNGAQIYAVNGAADVSENGIRQSAGAMVNYEYDLSLIEKNHERFVQSGTISKSAGFRVDALTAANQKKRRN